jgi:hypothetical protein
MPRLICDRLYTGSYSEAIDHHIIASDHQSAHAGMAMLRKITLHLGVFRIRGPLTVQAIALSMCSVALKPLLSWMLVHRNCGSWAVKDAAIARKALLFCLGFILADQRASLRSCHAIASRSIRTWARTSHLRSSARSCRCNSVGGSVEVDLYSAAQQGPC